MVACRQLGYSIATSASSSAIYGEGSSRIWIQNVNCHGNELDLLHCNFSEVLPTSSCNHDEDAGVTCSKTILTVLSRVYNVNARRNEARQRMQPTGDRHLRRCRRRCCLSFPSSFSFFISSFFLSLLLLLLFLLPLLFEFT